ncbi:MAG: hypothetical protein EG828_13750 [Deltaproteobacteria bacterium]|nr:hypothetical protein [Deltaproteobacteria bacterium]
MGFVPPTLEEWTDLDKLSQWAKGKQRRLGRFVLLTVFLCLLWVVLLCSVHAADAPKHNYKPGAGYVPDEKTAISIAVAVWGPIYGTEKIEKEKPYSAKLMNGVWHVSGALSNGRVGGVAEAEIQKNDGRIIRISHGK